jgi:outer membrane protein assembly factor BamB
LSLAVRLAAWTVARQELPDTPEWSVASVAPPIGAPVVAAGAIVMPLNTGSISALRVADGAPLWAIDLAAEQSLASDDERVYVASGEAIHALNAQTGRVEWRVPVEGKPSAPPLAHAGWVIAPAAGQILAIRATDGVVVWRQTIGIVEFRPALDGSRLVVSVADGRVVALEIETGQQKWERALGAAATEALAVGGRVYVGTADKLFFTLHGSSGRIESMWRVGAVVRGRAAVDDRHVYFAALDNVLYALDRGNGALKWRKGLTYRPAAGPVVLGEHVIVPGYVNMLPAFAPRTGEAAGHVPFPAGLTALPVFAKDARDRPIVIGISGSLENKWTVTLLAPSLVRALQVLPLTALPGEAVPLPPPPGLSRD